MSILPRQIEELLTFMDTHSDLWGEVYASIGVSISQAEAFKTLVGNARGAYYAQQDAIEAARAATLAQQQAIRAARVECQELIDLIKAFANASANPTAVLNTAQIPPPATPEPMGPPGQPIDMSVGIDATQGFIKLAWKCVNPAGASGTSYIIRRKTPSQTEWAFIGATGKKSFVDTTFTAGPDKVQYTVQAQRSDVAGPVSNILEVNFGAPGGGGLTIVSQSIAA